MEKSIPLNKNSLLLASQRSPGIGKVREIKFVYLVLFLGLHVPLALLMFQFPLLSTLHAFATIGIGLGWALNKKLHRVVYLGAYIAGSEVLWRMTEAQIFWEFGKYGIALIFIAALLRVHRLNIPRQPLVFFLLLLPSIWLAGEQVDIWTARRLISFNLSGPFALLVCAWFFSKIRLPLAKVQPLFIAFLAPIVGIAANAIFNTVTTADLQFANDSNVVTSGGFGPNQVASALGLGILMALLFLVFSPRYAKRHRALMVGLLLVFAVQGALTFSRGGLSIAFGSVVAASIFLFRDGKIRIIILVLGILLYLFAQYVIVPFLNNFTEGMLLIRFTDTSLTGRDLIMLADWEIFKENLAFGVGPGQARDMRGVLIGRNFLAHTEFSRLLAEHGLLGLGAMSIAIWTSWRNFKRASHHKVQAVIAASLTWTFLFLLVYAFRNVTPAFLYGLTFATIVPPTSTPITPHQPLRQKKFRARRQRIFRGSRQ